MIYTEKNIVKEYYIHELNCRMRYYDFPGNDIPILFLHGLGCAGSFDYPQVAVQRELDIVTSLKTLNITFVHTYLI